MDDRFWAIVMAIFYRMQFSGIREYCYAVCAALLGKRYRNESCHRRWDFVAEESSAKTDKIL
jgi:hypothetical protein